MPPNPPDSPIHWYEGLFLQPHHFQQSARRSDEALVHRARLLSPQQWGVVQLEIDEDALLRGQLVVARLEALLEDGLLVTDSQTSGKLEKDLSAIAETLEDGATLRVYLAVAEPQPKRVDTGGASEASFPLRFRSTTGLPVADETTGDNAVEIARLRVIARLVTDDEDATGLVKLPLIDVTYWGGALRRGDYIPPTVLVRRETALAEVLERIFVSVRERAARIASDHESAEAHRNELRVLESRFQALGLTASLPVLEQMLALESFRPVDFYLALCRYIAELGSLTGREIVPGLMPAYQHRELRQTFDALAERILDLIGPADSAYEKLEVRGSDGMFEVLNLRPEHLQREMLFTTWAGANADREKLIRWVERDCVVGSGDQIRDLVKHVVLGIERRLLDPRPIDLQVEKGTQVFRLVPSQEYLDALRRNQQLFFMRARKGVDDSLAPKTLDVYVKKGR